MKYQVWTEEYTGSWKRQDCEDIGKTAGAIMDAIKLGKTPTVTVEIPYGVNVNLQQEGNVEINKTQTEPDPVAGGAGDEPVQPRDPGPVINPGQGAGFAQPGDRPGD
ncbi:MAG: hypothetical protein A2Y89_06660 [Chloroflexi bacterium RBG_13_51_18]|nr:MAG: hypothetical protein A2Y89_06660 [Chloroflexi bacterium RBG_13_51_18]